MTTVCPTGPTNSKSFTCTFPAAGDYPFEMHTTSGEARVSVQTVVTVGGTLVVAKPVAVIDLDKDWGPGPLTVSFDASASFDLDGSIVSYLWDFSDSNRPEGRLQGQKVKKTFYQPGTYNVKLTVRDDLGNESVTYRDVHVSGGTNAEIIALNTSPLKVSFYSYRTVLPFNYHPTMSFWDFGDGTKYTGNWPEHTYLAPGTYNLSLKVIDLRGQVHNLTKTITIGAGVDAPSPGRINASRYNAPIYLNYDYWSTAYDPASQPLQYRWTFFDGQVVNTTTASRQYATPGYKTIQMIATNSRGLSSISHSYSEVGTNYNVIFARTKFDPKVGPAPLTVNFDGSGSSASPGKIVSQEWAINDQVLSFDQKMTYTFQNPGTYFVRYIATDNLGNQAATYEVVVATTGTPPPGNLAPNAVFSYSVDSFNARRIYFNCFSSTDDQWIAACSWKLNGTPLQDTMNGQVLLSQNILYNLELTVYDRWGLSSTVSRQFNYNPSPIQIVDFDHVPLNPQVGTTVKFGADQSTIPGRNITSYSWNFGDGNAASGAIVNHSYGAAGTYTVTLTLVDSTLASHTISKDITVVSSAPAAGLEILAQSADGSGSAKSGQTYRALRFPETIRFYSKSTTAAEGIFHDEQWDLGNGVTAYGSHIEYTYFKPGTYIVTFTGKTPSESTVTSSLTVEIPGDSCMRAPSSTVCITPSGANDNVLPISQSQWVFDFVAPPGYLLTESFPPQKWLSVISQDGQDRELDVSIAIQPSLGMPVLNLWQAGILKNGFDSSIPYKFKLNHSMSNMPNSFPDDPNSEPAVGETYELFFGAANLKIIASEPDIRVELVHGSSQRRIFAQGSDVTLNDLAYGKYAVIVSKGSKKVFRVVDLKSRNLVTLNVDLDVAILPAKVKNPKASSDKKEFRTTSLPSWTSSLCGEPSPFAAADARSLGAGEQVTRTLTSVAPSDQDVFIDINRNSSRSLTLSCGITSPALQYAHSKWKYKTGNNRCFGSTAPHPLWNVYLQNLKREGSPVILIYEVKDAWTGQVQKGHFVTSARDLMLKHGLTLDDLTSRHGIASATDLQKDWSQRTSYLIPVPPHFKRPQIKYRMISEHSSSNEDFYSVKCDIIAQSEKPAIASILPGDMNSAVHSPNFNSQLALSKRYNFFPVQFDGRATGAVSVSANSATVDFDVKIQRNDYKHVLWQGVQVQFMYGPQSFTKFYGFIGVGIHDDYEKTFVNKIQIDTADLENKFTWQEGVQKVYLKMTPIGKSIADYDFAGSSKTFSFVPLVDLQTVKTSVPQVCSEGFFGNKLSTFARDELVSAIVAGEAAGVRVRCGDASSPFGGPFALDSSWSKKGFESGSALVTRYFNTSGNHDAYDDYLLPLNEKKRDIEEIHNYALDMENIAFDPIRSDALLQFCKPSGLPPIAPCSDATDSGAFFSNKDFASQICLWNIQSGVMPPGCSPTIDASRLLRYASWFDLNVKSMKQWSDVAQVKFKISSGKYPGIATFPSWQRNAFVYGKIFNIYFWKTNPTGTAFIPENILSCHNLPTGCDEMTERIEKSNRFMDRMLVETGWN
ncbi:MAG: PKD domain-containing protein [Bdellovibrio sp.]|nr:PKD domain-containing protein [Bdellovibrio sp.]